MQNELPLTTKFTRKQTAMILTAASVLGLVTAFILSLIPSALEVKAMEILDNQTKWHEYQELIDANNMEIMQYQIFQEELENANEQLRTQIEASFTQSQE